MFLKQSTAATIIVGPVLDSTGAAYTGMAIGDFNITKNGSTAAMASAATATHSHEGHYLIALTTGSTDTVGTLVVSCNKSTYAMPKTERVVLQATVYDAIITNATTAAGGLGDIQRIAGTAQTAIDIGGNWTATRAGKIDNLDATISSRGTSTYAGGDTSGTTTLLSRLTAQRASNLDNLDASISGLNNLSALINIYGSPLLEIPDSSSTLFAFTVVVRDNEGKLVDLDASPTPTAANASGTSRSANLSAVSHPATGRYTFTYSVASTAAEESLRITVSGAVSTEARYIEWIGAVVNYDTLTQINAIKARTDLIPDVPATEANVTSVGATASTINTKLGTPASSVSADIAAVKADTNTLLTRITENLFSGITYLSKWLGALAGKTADTGTKAEINATTAGAGYDNTTDSQEAIRDNLPAAAPTASQNAAAILDAAASSHNTAGTIGEKINSSGSAGDPLLNAVPGTYSPGTAGFALGEVNAVRVIGPIGAQVSRPGEVKDFTKPIIAYHYAPVEAGPFYVYDEDLNPVDMSGYADDLAFVVFTPDESRTIGQLNYPDVIVDGTYTNQFTLSNSSPLTAEVGRFRCALRRRSTGVKFVRAQGEFVVKPCADVT